MIDKYFSKIYCINLDRREDRWIDSLKEFEKNNIQNVQRFSATDGLLVPRDGYPNNMGSGDIGSLITHLRIFNDAIKNNYENFLILEDDVEFTKNFNEKFEIAIKDVPSNWQVLQFGGNHVFGQPTILTENVAIPHQTLTTHAIAFNSSVYNDMILLLNKNQPNDVTYAYNLYKFNSFVFHPPLAWQRPSWSDVTNSFADYEFLKG